MKTLIAFGTPIVVYILLAWHFGTVDFKQWDEYFLSLYQTLCIGWLLFCVAVVGLEKSEKHPIDVQMDATKEALEELQRLAKWQSRETEEKRRTKLDDNETDD